MNWYKKAEKIDNDMSHVSNKREEFSIHFSGMRMYETDYQYSATFRQIDNGNKNLFWIITSYAFSYESGNTVYKKLLYYEENEYKRAKKDFEEIKKRITKLRHEQESNNIPSASIPNMIWWALRDIQGNEDYKPKGENNIVYINHYRELNEENKGNLFENIVYLNKKNHEILEPFNRNHYNNKGMF